MPAPTEQAPPAGVARFQKKAARIAGVMDAPYCLAMDEAENRLHVQKAVMMTLLGADQ